VRGVRAVLWLVVGASVAMTACGDDDEPATEESVAAAAVELSQPFCVAWVALEDLEGLDGAAEHVASLVASAPIEYATKLASFEDDFEAAIALVEGDADPTEDQIASIIQPVLAFTAESEVAMAAFTQCEGASDPRFQLACMEGVATALSAVGMPIDEEAAPTVRRDPAVVIAERQAEAGATEAIQREDEDGRIEVALRADDHTVEVFVIDPGSGDVDLVRSCDP
jgi:hypothetical protein